MVVTVRKFFQEHTINHYPFRGSTNPKEVRDKHPEIEISSSVLSTTASLSTIFEFKMPKTTENVEVTLIAKLISGSKLISRKQRNFTKSSGKAEVFLLNHECGKFPRSTMTLELTVLVKMEFPLKPRAKTRDFGQVDVNLTDVTLVVDEEKFHVNKVILATYSSYFYDKFFGQSSESEEIQLTDIDKETLQSFLESLYQPVNIDVENVANLLKAGRMYAAKIVSDQCQKFLIADDKLPREEKYRLANEYGLEELKAKIVMDD